MIIQKPKISEKSINLAKIGLYTFLVSKDARKDQIKKTIEKHFSVKVLSVKTMKVRQQEKLQRTRKGTFTVPGYKKALVSLQNGQKLDFFENTTKDEGEPIVEVKEKKSLLKGTKIKIEKESKKRSAMAKAEEKER